MRKLLGLGCALTLVACASSPPPQPEVTPDTVDDRPWSADRPIEPEWPREQMVVLLENEDGTVGKVDVSSPEGEATLDRPRQATSLSAPNETFTVSEEQLEEILATLTAEPEPAVSFTFYFDHGNELTEESEAELEKVLSLLRSRSAPEVTIDGHADRLASEDLNLKVSHDRALFIYDLLVEAGIGVDRLNIEFHGESKPKVETEDNVAEILNRRVELRIR